MERTMQTTRRYKRTRQPRRIVLLWLVCLFAAVSFGVLLWATIAMEAPVESTQFFLEDSGQLFTWLYPLHCLLLTGEDKDCYYFNDPLVGKNVAYPKEEVEAAYEGIGMQAVVLEGSVQ